MFIDSQPGLIHLYINISIVNAILILISTATSFFKALLSFLAWDQAPLWGRGENGKKWSEMAKKEICELSVLSSRLEMKKGWLCLPIFLGAFFSTVEPGSRLFFFLVISPSVYKPS